MDGWEEWREEGKQTTVYLVSVMCYCLRLYIGMTSCLPILQSGREFSLKLCSETVPIQNISQKYNWI